MAGSAQVSQRAFRLGELRHHMPQRAVIGLSDLWLGVHRAAPQSRTAERVAVFVRALRIFSRTPLNALCSVFSIGLALGLLGGALMLVDTVGGALRAGNEAVSFSVYLKDELAANPALPSVIEQRLREMPGVAEVEYISPSEALSKFETLLGAQAGILAGYEGDNPLPGSFSVQVLGTLGSNLSDGQQAETDSAEPATEALVERITALDGVEAVVYDQSLHHSLAEMLSALSNLAWVLVPLLCLVVAFMVASTVRLALHEHRDEIAIMRLMGASHRYVCAPFYAAAVLQGVAGAIIGLCVVRAGYGIASTALVDTPLSTFVAMPSGIAWWVGTLVVVLGIATAVLGSVLTLRKFSAEV